MATAPWRPALVAALVAALLAATPAGPLAWWTIPNIGSAAFAPQAYPFSQDFECLVRGTRGIGVLPEGNVLAPTAQGTPDMTVAIASGVAQFGIGTRVVYAGGNATVTTAHATLNRIDAITINSSGTVTVTAGTAATEANVEPPALPSGEACIAFVYVPAADTDIDANQITDKTVAVRRDAPTRYDHAGEILSLTPTANQNDYNPTGFSEASIVYLAANVSGHGLVGITGWVPTYTDRCFKLVNTDADDGIFLTKEDTASSAANRMTWGVSFPLVLFPSDFAEFCYDSAAASGVGRWRLVDSSRMINPARNLDIADDFPGGLSTYLGTAVNGTGASCQAGTFGFNTTEKPQGVVQCDTGTTATGRASIGYQSGATDSWPPAQGPAMFLSRLTPEALSTSGERFTIRVGFSDANSGTLADGCYWEYDEATDPDWRIGCSGASTATEVDTGVTVGTTYIWLGAYINAAWSRVSFFYSSDSVAWTLYGTGVADGNIPTSTESHAPYVSMVKSVGTTQRNMAIDFFGWRYDYAR